MFTAQEAVKLIQLSDEDFFNFLIDKNFVKTKDDAKLFLLEAMQNAQDDPSNEFPIHYFDNTVIPEDQKFVEFAGEALTDDYVDQIKSGEVKLDERCRDCADDCHTCPKGVQILHKVEEAHQITVDEYIQSLPADAEAKLPHIEPITEDK